MSMRRIGQVLRKIVVLSIPSILVCLLVAEVACRWVIRAASMPYSMTDPGPEKVLRYDTANGLRDGVYTVGRLAEQQARWHINNAGWNSEIDYLPPEQRTRPLIAIIGDSYVEGFSVDVDKNLGAQLRRRLAGGADVYTFGKSGAAMSEYLAMARYVRRVFAPRIIVVTFVHNDLHESVREVVAAPHFMQLTENNGTFEEVPPTSTGGVTVARRVLRSSALLRYLIMNLHAIDSIKALRYRTQKREANANVYLDLVAQHRGVSTRATQFLARKFAEENRGTPVIFVMDAPRSDLYAGKVRSSNVRWMNDVVRDAAAVNGIAYVDLTPPMIEEYTRTRTPLNTEVDYHWNVTGHRVAAEALYRELAGLMTPR